MYYLLFMFIVEHSLATDPVVVMTEKIRDPERLMGKAVNQDRVIGQCNYIFSELGVLISTLDSN